MPKTKILYFSHSAYLFGAEKCLLSLVNSLDKERFEAVVVLPADGPLKQRLDASGIRSHIVPLEWWVKNEGKFLYPQNELAQRLDQLLRIVAEEQPDVIHSNTSVIAVGAVAARMLGIPHVWHIHEVLVDHPSLEPAFPLPLLYHCINFLSERIVTVSDVVRRELEGYIPPDKVRIIYNGVPACRAESDAGQSLRSELGIGPHCMIAATVTSLQKVKGIHHLVAAAAQVVKHRPEVVFVIAGTGPRDAVAALLQSVKHQGLEDNVRYLGFRDDVASILAGSDLFVLPSLKEAFPLVVLEAMSQGKPVVATDCGGTAEMVTDGETGYLVPVGDPAALAEKMLALADDAGKRVSFGEAGAKRFFERFTEERYVATFAGLYDQLAAAPKPALQPKELSTLNALLAGYEGYIRAVRALPEKETAMQSLKHQSVELQALLADRDRKVSELDGRSVQQARELQRKSDELEQRDAVTLQQAAELRQKSAALQELKAVLLQQTTELQQKAVELEERDAVITALKVDLSDLDSRLAQLAEELDCAGELHNELEKRLDWKRAELVSRDDRIKQIRYEINKVGEQRVELERKLKQKTVELADRDERLRQVADEVAREAKLMEEQLRQKRQELAQVAAAREAEKRSHHQELARLSGELERLKQSSELRLREKEQRIDDLLQSISWKVTAPLRSAFDLVRGRR